MSETIGEAFVDIRARFDKFDKDLDRSRKTVDNRTRQMSASFQKVETSVSRVGARFAALGVAGVVVGLGRLIKGAADTADKLDKMARVAGVSIERIQTLRFAAEQTGVGADTMAKGVTELNKRLVTFVTSGAGPAKGALDALGVSADIQSGKLKSTEEVFDAVVVALGNVEGQAQKTAYAAQLFGDEAGPKMAALIGQGADALKNLEDRARDLGVVLSTDAVRGAVALRDKWGEVLAVMTAQFNSFALTTLRGLDAIFNITAGEKLRDRVLELRGIQDALAERSQGRMSIGNFLKGPTDNLEKRQSELLAEIRTLEEIEETRRRIQDGIGEFGGGGAATTTPSTGTGPRKKDPSEELDFGKYDQILQSARRRWEELVSAQALVGANDETLIAHEERVRLLNQVWTEFGGTFESIQAAIDAGILPENFAEEIDGYANSIAGATVELDRMEDAQRNAEESARRLNQELADISRSLADAILRGDSFNEILLMIGQSILDMQSTEDFLTDFFQNLFKSSPSGGGGGGGGIGGLLNTGLNILLNALPGFAEGGNPPIGKWSLVGENGPELVKFGAPARVYSNSESADMLGGAAGGSSGAVVNMTIVTNDADSFRRNRRQIMAEMSAGADRARVRDR